VAPTDDDLRGIFSRFCDDGDNGPPWIESEEFIQAARAVLARWGQPAATPIPVAERLPGPETGDVDLEANFRAWYQDAHGSAYFGAMPLCVAIGWAQHLLQQLSAPAQPPADGEVARFAGWLRAHRDQCVELGRPDWAHMVNRAAELLEQHHPTPAIKPVAVSERLPGPEDCNAAKKVWTTDYNPSLVYNPVWQLTELPRQDLKQNFSNAYTWRNVTHWLPANALPVPADV
jgi:hypothetical protein